MMRSLGLIAHSSTSAGPSTRTPMAEVFALEGHDVNQPVQTRIPNVYRSRVEGIPLGETLRT